MLSNAVKFSKQDDTVKVEILVYDLLEDSEKVELEIKVKDTGLGIYPEDLNNLFKPFFKSNDGTNLFMN